MGSILILYYREDSPIATTLTSFGSTVAKEASLWALKLSVTSSSGSTPSTLFSSSESTKTPSSKNTCRQVRALTLQDSPDLRAINQRLRRVALVIFSPTCSLGKIPLLSSSNKRCRRACSRFSSRTTSQSPKPCLLRAAALFNSLLYSSQLLFGNPSLRAASKLASLETTCWSSLRLLRRRGRASTPKRRILKSTGRRRWRSLRLIERRLRNLGWSTNLRLTSWRGHKRIKSMHTDRTTRAGGPSVLWDLKSSLGLSRSRSHRFLILLRTKSPKRRSKGCGGPQLKLTQWKITKSTSFQTMSKDHLPMTWHSRTYPRKIARTTKMQRCLGGSLTRRRLLSRNRLRAKAWTSSRRWKGRMWCPTLHTKTTRAREEKGSNSI